MDKEVIIAAINIIQRSKKRKFVALSTVLEAAVTLLDAEAAANSLLCITPDETLVRDAAANGEYRFGDCAKYLVALDVYYREQLGYRHHLLSGINVGLKHHTLNCISFTSAFSSLIGMRKQQLFLLLMQLIYIDDVSDHSLLITRSRLNRIKKVHWNELDGSEKNSEEHSRDEDGATAVH